MKISTSIIELVGHTPLVSLRRYGEFVNAQAEIVAKLEYFNPLSSVKDRLAKGLIEAIEKKGWVNEKTAFVEPTSGNTGIGLAFVCAAKGYALTIIMPESVSKERVQIVKALGAEVILTKAEQGMKGAIAKAQEMVENNPHLVMPMQFENLVNPEIHRQTTAQEILADTDGMIDIFVAGIGTGGTITGVGEVLKKTVKNVQIIAVEPTESAVLSGKKPGPHPIQGIGAGFIPQVLNTSVIDEIITVSGEDAFKTARLLAEKEGVFAGISSGAALYAATLVAQRKENKGKRVVVIIPDTGERYLSTALYEAHV
jgi:cysteine synthase A